MFTFPWTPFDYSSCCCISPIVSNFSFNNLDKMQCQTSYCETLRYSAQAQQTNLYPALSRMENEKITDQLHHDIMDALTLYSDNIPITITEEKKKKETIFDLDRLIFPDDPIRDWVEKKVTEIEKGSHVWYKKEEKQDMTIQVKPGDIVQLKPFDVVCDEDKEEAYGIPKSVYENLFKNLRVVRAVSLKGDIGSDSRYDFTFDVATDSGVIYVIPCTFIDSVTKTNPPRNNASDIEICEIEHVPSDPVIHPSHYNQNGMEVWDVINAFTKDLSGAEAFYAGNVIKYVLRWQHKNGIEDLEKAKVYIDKIIEMEK